MRLWIVGGAGVLGLVAALAAGCGGSNGQTGFTVPDGGSTGSSGGSTSGSGSSGGSGGTSSSGSFGSSGSGGSSSGSSNGPPLIYAHTDSELYSMDPTTHAVTDIGPFATTSGSTPTITDLAVDGNDDVWVNSESAIYKATLPASGTGSVALALQTQLPSSTKFYALGFAPAGMLGSGESLIAGDSAGSLYFVDVSTSSSTPVNLGSFGQAPGGGTYELSGDVVFYSLNGSPRGLATVRSCTSSCSTSNDYLAEIDIAALQTAYQNKTPAASLLKQMIGSGTGYGRLFGVGAWGNAVYAFAREGSNGNPPAQLVEIQSSGAGSSLQTFANITSGWSGAGVTTKAQISVLQ
ncbi:MAG TPA: hypothetical protein VIY73_26040 [Polyangiaceae bacterium]